MPLDAARQPVQGIAFTYESSEENIAEVASDGSVTALKPGVCFVTAVAGQVRAKVLVEVRDGLRPGLTNAQWDIEHAGDCTDPERDPSIASYNSEIQSSRRDSSVGTSSGPLLPAPENDPPPFIPEAASRKNAVGHPRFSPDLKIQGGMDNQLGSDSFNMTIPIFGSGGRGVGVDLNLVYNSRVWTKDVGTNHMVFDYDVGWPAPGFRLNYGRIIRDYDVSSGDGNYLLIEGDGTRTPLYIAGNNNYRSNDGRYLKFTGGAQNQLYYTDGSIVFYEQVGANKLLPTYIRDVHGNSISISYVANCADAPRVGATCNCSNGCTKPTKQAIKQITDSLGRVTTFYYDNTGKLAEIRVPGYNGVAERTLVRFGYRNPSLTLSYNFDSSLTVVGVPDGNQVDVLSRMFFPDTGRGYVFDPYSGYGMFTHASMRLGMTDTSDGTEVAYTEYAFGTTGTLLEPPEYTQRREWWLHKTDDSGNDTTSPAVYDYSRTSDSTTTTRTVAGPNGISTVMVSNNDGSNDQFGLLTQQKIVQNGVTKLTQDFTYDSPSTQQGLQRNSVITTDDGSPANKSQVTSTYGTYGRLMETIEYGFSVSDVFTKRRRTVYTYLDDVNYTNLNLFKLVTDVTVWDTLDTNNNGNDVPIARTGFVYDTSDTGWEIETYGFTHNCAPPACTPPPGYDTKFADRVQRGLVTTVQLWTNANASPPNLPDISFRHKYDVFGNELKAEVGCCSVKSFEFRDTPVTNPPTSAMYWSVPFSSTDGGGASLQSNYSYDFNTSFLKYQTDPNGLLTTYAPDAAMRLRTVTYPKLTGDSNPNPKLDTFYADASNNLSSADTLTYQSKYTYFDGTTKVQISNQWLDGAGRAIRQGSASGPTIASFDATKVIYDELSRLRKSSNPYNTTNSDGNTSGLPNATIYDYDGLSRAVTVTLPDSNTVTTAYNGALTTVTDQAGRQRRSEVDGLGRTITVTEMDDSKVLNWNTSYGYDKNDNLTSVNQGTQTRAFKYDSLSRMTYERTPEQDATINDGTGTLWSAHYTYTSFNAVSTRQDARGVLSNYSYDGLNRLYNVAYTTAGTTAQATASVNITYGSAVPKLGQVEEIKQTDSQSNIPWKENYSYDSLSRVTSKTVSFDNQAYAYTTGYGYNQAGQLTQMTYPSNRVVKYGFDSRGRLNALGDSTLATKYVSGMSYQPSQQVGSISLNNGVTESYGYSADRLQLTSQTATKSSNTLMSLTYNYVASKDRSGGTGTTNVNTGQLMAITNSQIKDLNGVAQQRNESYNYDQ